MQRRKRDPDGTRLAILEAAGKVLAKEGPEGLSVSEVAKLAGVNRGTAYQHFPTREDLLVAAGDWVSERLCKAVFGDRSAEQLAQPDPQYVAEQMALFAMENPELGRVWLFELLNSDRPAKDPFWNQYRREFEAFARSDAARPGIDAEVQSIIVLIATFLWPVFARAHVRTARERVEMARRFSDEILRLSLHGTMKPEQFASLVARVEKLHPALAGTSVSIREAV